MDKDQKLRRRGSSEESLSAHQIDDIPNAEMTLRFGQQDSPNACLLCHTDKSAQWVQAELLSWKTKPLAAN